MALYDAIAAQYRRSKSLPFRTAIERFTLFELLPDPHGLSFYDLACGEGHYARQLLRAGAAHVTGVDISPEMITLAQAEERERPLGARYFCCDVAEFDPPEPADVVVAMFLLHYAPDRETLARFLATIRRALVPGGRLVGFLDNVHGPPDGGVSWARYGFERFCSPTRAEGPREGEPVFYRFPNPDGTAFEFSNNFWKPETYKAAFDESGLADFRWERLRLEPAERGNPLWDAFLAHPPFLPITASRPGRHGLPRTFSR